MIHRRWLVAVPVICAVVAGAAGISHASDDPATAAPAVLTPSSVPPELTPPAGNVLSSVFGASGVQVYQCTAGAWVFTEPAASLQGRSAAGGARQSVVHFRGPSWESTDDGSLVEAAVAVASPSPGTIPQLLLKATKTRGSGILGGVTYVQRLATHGGAAPAGSCQDGTSTGVPYQAIYRFFSPAV
ncbi:MAG: hypothetical protein JWO79_5009 [Actinomycetia bacterium]|nr:hypothetical protein [Actinomycetes bacterium]